MPTMESPMTTSTTSTTSTTNTLTIGQVAREADVGVETIRFYEREGLIAEPPRRMSGYRQFPLDTVDLVRFIKRAKALGFSLKEIRDLLTLRVAHGATCREVKARAMAKITDIEKKIRDLQRMNRALKKLADACTGTGPVDSCPILTAMAGAP